MGITSHPSGSGTGQATETTLAAVKADVDKIPASPATDATLTGGTQKAINRGGAKGATAASDITSTAEGADHQAMDVQLYSGGAAVSPALDATLTGGNAKAIARGGAKGATTAADLTSTAQGADHQSLDVQIYSGGAAVNPATIRALTSADVVTAAQGSPAAQANAWIIKPRQLVTFSAVFRLAARPFALSWASGGAARKQWATIFHAAGATKTVRIRRVTVSIESSSAAAIVMLDLVRLTSATTPATGNPAITPVAHAPADSVEATCLALPTTAGTESVVISSVEWNLGITGAASIANPPPPLTDVVLYDDQTHMEVKPLEMRAGNAEGFAVSADASASSTIKGYVRMICTEE